MPDEATTSTNPRCHPVQNANEAEICELNSKFAYRAILLAMARNGRLSEQTLDTIWFDAGEDGPAVMCWMYACGMVTLEVARLYVPMLDEERA